MSATGTKPVADFTASPTNITEGQSIQFTDQSTNTPTSWSWNFGDGGTSSSQHPLYQYNTEGTYTVTLTTTNSYGSDSETKSSYITVESLISWQKSLGGSYNETARCIEQTTDGGYIIAGYGVVKVPTIATIQLPL